MHQPHDLFTDAKMSNNRKDAVYGTDVIVTKIVDEDTIADVARLLNAPIIFGAGGTTMYRSTVTSSPRSNSTFKWVTFPGSKIRTATEHPSKTIAKRTISRFDMLLDSSRKRQCR